MTKILDKIDPYKKPKQIHTCSNCDKKFEWAEGCYWYGSWENVEIKACSSDCMMKSHAALLIREEAQILEHKEKGGDWEDE